jgi:GxxExxY protein
VPTSDCVVSLDTLKTARESILSTIGTGLSESIYVNALCVELSSYHVKKEHPIPLLYKNVIIGILRADIVITNDEGAPVFIIEAKSTMNTLEAHQTQLKRYMDILGVPGALVNFNKGSQSRVPDDVYLFR